MIATDRGRFGKRTTLALAAAGMLGLGKSPAPAQQAGRPARSGQAPAAAPADGQITAKMTAIPVHATDPIAIINGEVITRQQLADECVATKGEEVLDILINRKLLDQAVRAKHVDITAAEIDAEIDRIAQSVAKVNREEWLKMLIKERKISPVQYARYVIYPNLALRKLALPLVEVTEKDIKEAFDAAYGAKLRCRMIMTSQAHHARAIWEELKKNPSRFAAIAKDDPRSVDQVTRSMGGLLPDPLSRHMEPREVSDKIFADLVDGDPADKGQPARQPKDGDISGIIQVNKESWVIFMREELIPAQKVDPQNKTAREAIEAGVREGKLKQKIEEVYRDIRHKASIENRLTAQFQLVDDGKGAGGPVDAQVRQSAATAGARSTTKGAAAPAKAAPRK